MTKLPLALAVSKAEAEQKIRQRIDKGREIKTISISSRKELSAARVAEHKWSDYNEELLKQLFKNQDIVEEYRLGHGPSWGLMNIDGDAKMFRDYVHEHMSRLESVLERLEILPEVVVELQRPEQLLSLGHGVFIVHGHDEAAKQSAARLVEKIGLTAIILHEQPNAGRTIIEKFEDYSNVSFAIVLLTPDDIGAPEEKPGEIQSRARQNVILEFGYFMGKLGRGRVCALYKEGVEIPSDYQGVLYVPMDSAGVWKMKLAKEIKNAGIEVDLNKL